MNQDTVVSIVTQAMEVTLKVALPVLLAEASDQLGRRHPPTSEGIDAYSSAV